MKIIVIGSGFGGLSAAIRLQAQGHQVTIAEKRDKPGGRAYRFQQQHSCFTIFCQAIGNDTTCRTCTNHDVIVLSHDIIPRYKATKDAECSDIGCTSVGT